MSERSVYDTRFFIEYFYSKNLEFLKKLKEDLKRVRGKVVSVLTIHEVYRISLEKEGRDVADLRGKIICKDFKVVNVDYDVAVRSAELRSKYRIPMADSVIAATAQMHKCTLASDDPLRM
ncbi:PIN domain-containing protein, partial [Candidatus Bathyarchaeota archaeon]|nr:PIN domain-containing protein [Candidatus Bathyarchaeota archaeon]